MRKDFQKTFNYLLVTGLLVATLVWVFAFGLISADTKGEARVTFLDVGQGDSALINLPDSKQILIDTGDQKEVLGKIEKNMPFLDRKIEYLVLSHADSDHVGMALEIMQSFTIGEVIVGPSTSDTKTYQKIQQYIADNKLVTKQVKAGDNICPIARACMEFVSPKEGAGGSSNDQSLVFRFSLDGAGIMFTGDGEDNVQNQIDIGYPKEKLESQILKVAHHGSRKAVDQGFLEKVNPKTAIISVGKNSYGHPTKEAIEALKNKGLEILRTDELGDIKFSYSGGAWAR